MAVPDRSGPNQSGPNRSRRQFLQRTALLAAGAPVLAGLLDVLHGQTGLSKLLGLMKIDGKLKALTKKNSA